MINGDLPNLVMTNIYSHGKSLKHVEVLIGKSSINGLFSMAMLNNQMVFIPSGYD